MYMARVCVEKNNQSDLFVESVASVRATDGRLVVRTIFGEQKEVKAVIKEIDFLNSSVVLKIEKE